MINVVFLGIQDSVGRTVARTIRVRLQGRGSIMNQRVRVSAIPSLDIEHHLPGRGFFLRESPFKSSRRYREKPAPGVIRLP